MLSLTNSLSSFYQIEYEQINPFTGRCRSRHPRSSVTYHIIRRLNKAEAEIVECEIPALNREMAKDCPISIRVGHQEWNGVDEYWVSLSSSCSTHTSNFIAELNKRLKKHKIYMWNDYFNKDKKDALDPYGNVYYSVRI